MYLDDVLFSAAAAEPTFGSGGGPYRMRSA